jgi:ubiquinone/menaquinone biosynthesis C-methylase UbiE
MPLFNHFNFLAPFYESFIHPAVPEKIIAAADLPVAGMILDAGGGTGRIAQFLCDKAAFVVVADESFEMLQEAGKKSGLNTLCSHTEKMPFKENSFERIIMVDALHHVGNQPQTSAELWRILAPTGRIVIEEPDISSFRVKLIALAEKIALMRSHFLSPPQIASLFNYPNAHVHIERDGTNAWIIVEKEPG